MLVALPAAAVVLLALAGVGGLLDSGSQPQVEVTPRRESFGQATTAPPHERSRLGRAAAQGRRARGLGCRHPGTHDRPGAALLGAADARR